MATSTTGPLPHDPEEEQWGSLVGAFEKKRAELWEKLESEDARLVREYQEWRRQLQERYGVNENTRGRMDRAWSDLCKERKRRERIHWEERQRLERELDVEFEEWRRKYYAEKTGEVIL